ncbi:NKAP family protein-like isoform X2 [Battus philenor]|uniref:NKAP family protein-like isoform X2 n=1 Tax=Battus philenor TaxID=42288 RepID=UPI0035D00391
MKHPATIQHLRKLLFWYFYNTANCCVPNLSLITQPWTLERLQSTFTADERRAIHDAVVQAVPSCHDLADLALPSRDCGNMTKEKSRAEILAELRDMKRRRPKYRVAAKTRNYSDVLRDVITTQMDLYTDAIQSKESGSHAGSIISKDRERKHVSDRGMEDIYGSTSHTRHNERKADDKHIENDYNRQRDRDNRIDYSRGNFRELQERSEGHNSLRYKSNGNTGLNDYKKSKDFRYEYESRERETGVKYHKRNRDRESVETSESESIRKDTYSDRRHKNREVYGEEDRKRRNYSNYYDSSTHSRYRADSSNKRRRYEIEKEEKRHRSSQNNDYHTVDKCKKKEGSHRAIKVERIDEDYERETGEQYYNTRQGISSHNFPFVPIKVEKSEHSDESSSYSSERSGYYKSYYQRNDEEEIAIKTERDRTSNSSYSQRKDRHEYQNMYKHSHKQARDSNEWTDIPIKRERSESQERELRYGIEGVSSSTYSKNKRGTNIHIKTEIDERSERERGESSKRYEDKHEKNIRRSISKNQYRDNSDLGSTIEEYHRSKQNHRSIGKTESGDLRRNINAQGYRYEDTRYTKD